MTSQAFADDMWRIIQDDVLRWNEQYLLQPFLAFNSRFEVNWPGNYMMVKYPEKVCQVFPEFHIMRKHYPMSEPSAFWMRSISSEGSTRDK
jgi:hypothetical protein